MRTPTALQFFTAYALVWALGIFLIFVYSDTSGRFGLPTLFMKMACYNICFVILNVVGMVITMETGKAPWRN